MQFTLPIVGALSLLTSSALGAPTAVVESRGLLAGQTQAWAVRNFTRICSADQTKCTYDFKIDLEDGSTPVACTVVNTGAPATSQSWYGVPCSQNANWVISWGWDYINFFTVMTTVYEPTQLEAFFGYNRPNTATSYPDVGPNAVQHT